MSFPSEEEMIPTAAKDDVKQAYVPQYPKQALHYFTRQYLDKEEVRKGFGLLMSKF